jgi:hypothetical protein
MITVLASVGFALLCGWVFADSLATGVTKTRSWYVTPLVAVTMLVLSGVLYLLTS